MMKSMKRIIGLMVMAGMLMFPVAAKAADGQTGVYVAPKFVYGYLLGYDVETYFWRYTNGDLDEQGRHDDESMKGDHVFGGALAVGYDFSKRLNVPLRGELEYALFSDAKTKDKGSNQNLERLNLGIQTIFANIYYDFRNSSAFTPYLGLGVGMASVKAKGQWSSYSMGSKTSTNFAWNVGAGVAYAFTDMISLDFAYRLVSPGKGQTKKNLTDYYGPDDYWYNQVKTDKLYIHQVLLGVRFTF